MADFSAKKLLVFLFKLASFILIDRVQVVEVQGCDNSTFSIRRGNNPGDIFTRPSEPCSTTCQPCELYNAVIYSQNFAGGQCSCQCLTDKRTFDFDSCRKDFSTDDVEQCEWKAVLSQTSQQIIIMGLPQGQDGFLLPKVPLHRRSNSNPIPFRCEVVGEYFYQFSDSGQSWETLSTLQDSRSPASFFSFEFERNPDTSQNNNFIKFHGSHFQNIRSCFSGLIIGLRVKCNGPNAGCLSFRLSGTLSYDPSAGIAPCLQDSTTVSSTSTVSPNGTTKATTTITAAVVTSSKYSSTEGQNAIDVTNQQTKGTTSYMYTASSPDHEMPATMRRHGDSTPAIIGGVCAAAIIFIIAGVVVFILWRRKFRPNSQFTGKGNRGVTMSSLQNGGHPHSTEGTVDNEIYAGDDAGIVDNVIYEGGAGGECVFSNPGYADKTPQFKPRMDAPNAFIQKNPGATNKTPQPQRNTIINEPQYAQIVEDEYVDPKKVRKDKKKKRKSPQDKDYADLKKPHENNSNSNHVYEGLRKGGDYQSLHGPREHHEVRPSQLPTSTSPQDGHDYTSLTPGGSSSNAATLSDDGPDYTVLEGPDSPGEETNTGSDYTTLEGPDSPGDEITSAPDSPCN